MAKPRPVPPNRRLVEESAWVKGAKILANFSGAMPIPVSDTENRSETASAIRCSAATCTTTSPLGVNLIALFTKFISTCRRRNGSPISASGNSSATWYTNSRPFS